MTTSHYRTSVFDQLADPTSTICQKALLRPCYMCGADAGHWCIQMTNGYPLSHRRVHYARTDHG